MRQDTFADQIEKHGLKKSIERILCILEKKGYSKDIITECDNILSMSLQSFSSKDKQKFCEFEKMLLNMRYKALYNKLNLHNQTDIIQEIRHLCKQEGFYKRL